MICTHKLQKNIQVERFGLKYQRTEKMVVLKSINEFPDNAMDILQDIDDYKKFCYENKLPFRYNHLYKPYTPWKIFYNWKKSGKLDLTLWSRKEQ